ncbi:transposase [Bifidobacterium thermophilum]|uniref:Transposase n=1 Tax=Bifidobacterium thermophilum TaxID=33905 RepID=A0A2N3QEX1_9BIFI|nr:transposase [Bifidobacterium thermophilum]
MTVAWLAEYLPRSAVSRYMRIDWQTVGGCVSRALHDLEPERGRRLDGLVNIGIDETSYRKGYKFVTVVVNHDTNTVVWVGDGHGKSVLERFYRSLSAEQLASIRTVTGDGARWITDCVNEFTPGCERCVDPFHVVEWAKDALDEVRRERWRTAREQAGRIAEGVRLNRGRPRAGDGKAVAVREARKVAAGIKGSAFALGKAPENLTDGQRARLDMIRAGDPKLYRAYRLKESLRLLLKTTDAD